MLGLRSVCCVDLLLIGYVRQRDTLRLTVHPTSPPPTGLFRRRQLPVPEYRPHPSKIPGSDTRQLPARLFSGFARPPSAVLAPGPSECICSSRAITGSPWPGLVQQPDQIAASAIYPYSLGFNAAHRLPDQLASPLKIVSRRQLENW